MYTYTVKKSDWSETSLKRAFVGAYSGSHVNKVTFFQHPTIFTDTGHIGADFALFSDPYLNHQELPANLEESRQLLKQFAEFHSILQAAPHDLC